MSTKNEKNNKIILEEFMEEQKKKIKKGIISMIIIGLILGGISGVASYTLTAGSVGYAAKDTTWEVDNTQDAIDELRDTVGYTLVGSIFSYMGTFAPFGYLACDGTVYNISDYPRLANHIKNHFGTSNYFGGDGTTTFAVPDLRGEFLRGTGTNSHTNQGSGANVGVHQDGTKTAVVGTSYESGRNYISFPNAQSVNAWGGYANADAVSGTATNAWVSSSGTNANARSVFVVSRPTNTSVLYIIKY